jgi:hypothetical protein
MSNAQDLFADMVRAKHRKEDQVWRIERLTFALENAKAKLKIYRAANSGEYEGGMEYSALMHLIDGALSQQELESR